MRRADREVTELRDILDILKKCDAVRLGINTPDSPYIVPLCFGFDSDGDAVTLWFHCATEGSKLDLINRDPRVGFEADCSHRLVQGDRPCSFSMEFESVIGAGHISICSENAEKQRGFSAIMRQYAHDEEYLFSDAELSRVCILKLDVEKISAKRLMKPGT